MLRKVANIIVGVEQEEGQGAKVVRTIGSFKCENLDPFLLLDEFKVSKSGGFPEHPHRGFETVTLVLKGAIKHEDILGNSGIIRVGDIQWMTAGRGVAHSEFPVEDGINHGIQLWINLKKLDKMIPPSYQDFSHENIPIFKKEGVTVKIIAGECMGIMGVANTKTPALFLHVVVAPGADFVQEIKESWTAFSYVIRGTVEFGPIDEFKQAQEHCLVIFENGPAVGFRNKKEEEAEFILIAGEPIKEPIVKRGPFVMNTQEEIRQAMTDYQFKKNGFELVPKS